MSDAINTGAAAMSGAAAIEAASPTTEAEKITQAVEEVLAAEPTIPAAAAVPAKDAQAEAAAIYLTWRNAELGSLSTEAFNRVEAASAALIAAIAAKLTPQTI